MPRVETFTCCLSGLAVAVDTSTDPVTYTPPDPNDNMPEGWGVIVGSQMIKNPEWTSIEAERANAAQEFAVGFAAARADPNCPPEQLAEMAAIGANLTDAIAQRFPLPDDEWLYEVKNLGPLSPEAYADRMEVLARNGK